MRFLIWGLAIILAMCPAMSWSKGSVNVKTAPLGGDAIKTPSSEKADNSAPVNARKTPESQNQILTRLPNGLVVYILKDTRFPLVCTRLYVRAGSANEQPNQAGISHLLEHMVFKGTSHRPKGKVAEDVESLGGYLNAATSFDKTWYITDMPATHWQMGMDVVKDMAFQASLDPAELEAEKDVVISELQRGEDSPMRKLYENLQVAALKNTPYGRPIIGYENTIRNITAQDLRAYVDRWYQPQNMMLLVAGNIDPTAVLDYAQTLFGKLENKTDLAIPQPLDLADADQGSQAVEVKSGPWNKVYLGIALPVPGYHDLRSVELDMLAYLLGGDGTSEFYKKYKYDLQLVDAIDVGNMSLARAGLFTIIAQLEPEKVEPFWADLTIELGKLRNKVFDKEAIARARFNLEDSMDRAGETLNGLASWRGTVQFDLGGKQGEENIRFTQANVDNPQLRHAIDEWLNSANARVRVMAPENAKLPDFNKIMQKNWPPAAIAAKHGDASAGAGKVEVIDWENGCKIILIPDASAPYVAFNYIMAGGNAMLKPDQQGLAGLVARMLTDGSGSLNNPAMEKWFSERAASVSAGAGLQTFGLSLTGPSRFNQDYFEIIRDILRKPRFEPGELAREVDNMKAALRQRLDQPLSYMFSKINPFLFPDNQPYGYDSLGTPETLDTFNVMGVRDFWTRQVNQPWVLAVAGDFDRDEILNFVKSLPVAHGEPFTTRPPVWDTKKDLDLTLPGRNQAHLMQIFRTVPLTHEDAPALMLLQAILSGQSGLLFKQLRDEEGLGYTVTAFNRSMPEAGFMAFYIGTEPEKMEAAKNGFAKIIADLKAKPLPAELLKAGSTRLQGEYLRDRQSLSARASEAATEAILHYPQDFQHEMVEKTFAITPQQLQEVINKYLVNPYEVSLKP